MKKNILTLLFVLFIGVISASAQEQFCFSNDGLKGTSMILFTVTGNEITDGEFSTISYEEDAGDENIGDKVADDKDSGDENVEPEKALFTGTKNGNVLTIKFTEKVPDEFSNIKTIKWTLGESLNVQMYGKDNTTNKWGVYSATFTECVGD